jgi:hypothetical protein
VASTWIASGSVQLAAHSDVVGEDGQGEGHGGHCDDQGAGRLP